MWSRNSTPRYIVSRIKTRFTEMYKNVHEMKYYPAKKRNEFLTHTTTNMPLENLGYESYINMIPSK
jgi:hypothetical protein